jgi:hypothetical protein
MAPGPRAGPIPVGQLGNPEGSLERWKGETALGLAPLMCITCKGCLVADGRAGYRYTQCIMCHENKTHRNTISNSDRLHLFMTRTEIVEFWRCHGIVVVRSLFWSRGNFYPDTRRGGLLLQGGCVSIIYRSSVSQRRSAHIFIRYSLQKVGHSLTCIPS